MRRLIAIAATVLVLATSAVATTGCGAAAHYLGGVVAHHVLNHVVGVRNANKIFCLYHGHRVIADFRNHHYFIAGLNGLAAYRACKGGFGHR